MLLLATISTLLLAADVIAQESQNSAIADTVGRFFTVTSNSGGYYPSSGENSEQEDGILTSFLTGPVINNLVQNVFNVVEFKLNLLIALKRIFSYENIKTCLQNIRKFLNLVLRFCVIVNKFLPQADLDTNGLSTLISVYPSKFPDKVVVQDKYGVPEVQTSTFAPVTTTQAKPSSEYGVPAKPSEEYGVPAKPSNDYGVPAKPSNEYGVPNKPTEEYGVPAKPSNEYGVPSQPSDDYGVPAEPSNEYGVPAHSPSKPSDEYGVPPKPSEEYGVPAKVTEIDDDEKDAAITSYTSKIRYPTHTSNNKYKSFIASHVRPSSVYGAPKPAEDYGIPAEVIPVGPSTQYGAPQPADEYGVPAKPHDEYGAPQEQYGPFNKNSFVYHF